MKSLIDINAFADAIASAMKQCYGELASTNRNEQIYGFAICTTDDWAGIWPAATTESGFKARRDKLLSDEKQLAWLADKNIEPQETILVDERWSPYEWELTGERSQLQLYINANNILESAIQSAKHDNGSGNFRHLTAEVHAASAIALRMVRDANGFGNAAPKITLFCSKHSSSDTVWLERESARFLNPRELFEQFKIERIDLITGENDHDNIEAKIFDEILSLAAPNGQLIQCDCYNWWHRLERELRIEGEKVATFGKPRKRPKTGPPCPKCGDLLFTPNSSTSYPFGIMTPVEVTGTKYQGTCTPQDHTHVGRTPPEDGMGRLQMDNQTAVPGDVGRSSGKHQLV